MKKTLCWLLCLLLLPLAALAEDPSHTDIAALMARQVSGNSTLRTQLTAEFSPQSPSLVDREVWDTLRAYAQDTALESTYVFSRAGETLGNSQAVLSLKRGEQTLSSLRLSGRGEQWQIWGDALGSTLLTLPRDTSLLLRSPYLTLSGWGSVLLRGLGFAEAQLNAPAEGQWPNPLRFFTAAATETDAWKARLEEYTKKYTDQLSAWMQEKTKLYLVKEESGIGTQSELRLTADELADEALTLLDLLYHDNALLSLLREQTTLQEARSYLEPGMILLFEQTLRTMELPEGLTLVRRYDPEGGHQLTVLRLPMADGTVLVWENDGAVNTYGLEKGDLSLRFGVSAPGANAWQGKYTLQRGETERTGAYQLFVSMEPVYEDENENGRQRRQNGTVTALITPDEGQGAPQTLTVTVTAWAGLENDQPAHWNAELDWQEGDTGAYARVSLKTRTGAAIQQQEAEGQPLDFSQAGREEQQSIWNAMLEHWRALLSGAQEAAGT